jgi:flagellar biosynthesis GTPase FlhF
MLRNFSLASVMVLAMAAPALADASSCYEPIAPAAVDGNTATEAQLKSSLSDVKDFIKASDDYQTCLISDLQEQKRQAARSKDKKPLDPSIEADVNARVSKNQALKEQVGNEYNAAVHAYQAKHPSPAPAAH